MPSASPSRRLRTLALPCAAVVTALAFGGPASAAPAPTAPSPTVAPAPVTTTTGIIMRDGGVCDPIRHIGC
jgi:hypothetical protein